MYLPSLPNGRPITGVIYVDFLLTIQKQKYRSIDCTETKDNRHQTIYALGPQKTTGFGNSVMVSIAMLFGSNDLPKEVIGSARLAGWTKLIMRPNSAKVRRQNE